MLLRHDAFFRAAFAESARRHFDARFYADDAATPRHGWLRAIAMPADSYAVCRR